MLRCILGSGRFASQKGMAIGSVRQIAEKDTGAMSAEAKTITHSQTGMIISSALTTFSSSPTTVKLLCRNS